MTQHMEALAKANRIRFRIAQLKRDIASETHEAAESYVADFLRNCDSGDELRIRTGWLLSSIPGWGHVKTARVLERLRINPDKPVGNLTRTQRVCLASAVQGSDLRVDVHGFVRELAA